MKSQTYTSPSGWFTLEFPRTWEYDVIEGIPAFYEGLFQIGGVLQVYSVRLGDPTKQTDIVANSPFLMGSTLDEKMALFLDAQEASYTADDLRVFEKEGMEVLATEYHLNGRFYLAMMLQKGAYFVLALYNVAGEPEAEEAQAIAFIVQSIRITAV